jgi:phosphate transport system substrate-binding protein
MKKQIGVVVGLGIVGLALAACGGKRSSEAQATAGSGSAAPQADVAAAEIKLDGSSTVLPLSEAVAEEFQKQRKSRVTVGASGTGGGFQKLCNGEIDLAAASRPIKAAEAKACAARGVGFIEVPVAYDALSVVVNPQNSWVDFLTVEELKKMWAPEAQKTVTKWSQIRAGWPDEELRLFGAGVDSGTYDYFTKAIVGTEHASRGDYTSGEDDNVLVQGVSTDKLALGFFGFSYFEENASKLRVVPIDDGKADNGPGPVSPSAATVLAGTYQPLSRPLFVYVSVVSLKRAEVAELASFYTANASRLSREVGFIPLSESTAANVKARFEARTEGSLFPDGSTVDVHLDELMQAPPAAPPAGSGSGGPGPK